MSLTRTLASTVRTVFYAGLAIFLALRPVNITGVLDAALVGGVLADFTTWVIWSLLFLPRHLAHGMYEAVINLAFGVLVYQLTGFEFGADMDAESLGMLFLAYMAVGAVKATCLVASFIDETFNE